MKLANPLILNLIGSSLLCIGGIIGYAKTESIASLLAGIIFSALISITTIYTSQNGVTSNKGLRFLILIWSVLMIIMGYRFFKSGKFMPAGLISTISLMEIVANFSFYRHNEQ